MKSTTDPIPSNVLRECTNRALVGQLVCILAPSTVIADAFRRAQELLPTGVTSSVIRVNGLERITTTSGGRIVFRHLGKPATGGLAADLLVSTLVDVDSQANAIGGLLHRERGVLVRSITGYVLEGPGAADD